MCGSGLVIPFGWISAGAAVIGTVSNLAKGSGSGGSQGASDLAGAQDAAFRQEASDLYKNLELPKQDKTPLQGQTWLQDYAPQAYDPYIGQVSQMSDDPASIAAEKLALGQMQGFARGGLQPSDIAALQAIQQQQAGAESSAGATTQAAMQARGLGGAGAELAGRLAGNQGAENAANQSYNAAMAQAMQRQLTATTNAGNMASNNRTQDANISQSMAAINNTFNTQVQNLRTNAAANAANIANQAQQANLTGRQTTANNNVANNNANVALQNSLAQANFNNMDTKITGQANALNAQATLAGQEQSALATRALGQQQATTAGLTGLADVAKQLGSATNSGSNGSSSPNWFSNLMNNQTTQTNPADGMNYQSSNDPNMNW